jgi:hypothetical protein
MLAVSSVSTQFSSGVATGAAACGGFEAGGSSPAAGGSQTATGGNLLGSMGALGLQTSLLAQSGKGSGFDLAGALALGMLLGKNDESKDKENSMMAFAMLAMAAGMQQQGGQTISFTQNITQVQGAYEAAAGGSACAAAGSVSVQA